MSLRTHALAAALALSTAASVSAQAPAAPIATKSGPLSAPAPGKGLVVFFRPASLFGVALGCTVHEGDAEVARLGSGKFFAVPAAPGKHEYFTQGERTDRLTLEVEDGETYFVKCALGVGIMGGRPNISPSDQTTFAAKAKGLTMWKGGAEHPAAP